VKPDEGWTTRLQRGTTAPSQQSDHPPWQGYSVFGEGLQIKPKTSERILCYVGLCLTGMPTMTQNPFIKVDLHESLTPSTHRGLLQYRRLLPGAWQMPSFIRYARPGVLCHDVWRPERQCHRRMGTPRRHRAAKEEHGKPIQNPQERSGHL